MYQRLLILPVLLVLQFSAPARASNPLRALAVYPPDINLETRRDRQSFLVQATFADGITRDVTAAAEARLADPTLAELHGNMLAPAADGKTTLNITYAGKAITVPVTVRQADADRPISFTLDVMPVFMKTSCNQGSCHGAARGKDGFRLSLFGFDPDGDHYRLTREINGRRINLALPHESLLIEKATGKVPHTGGQRIKEGDAYYQTLIRWLEARAPKDPGDVATPTSLEVYPPAAVLDGKGTTQQLTVRAKYSDGTDRDVTELALFLSNNDTSAKIADSGLVTAGERGEAFIMARFATFTVGVPFIVLPEGLEFEFPKTPEYNYIDTLVHSKLRNLRMAPSGVCSDEVFLRRATLDITGMLPTPEEYARFRTDAAPDKRARLVDELLGRKEFAEMWVMKWAELLQIRTTNQVSKKSMLLYFNWLQDKIARNVQVNQWVVELLSANGGTFQQPATNYYQNERDILKVTENVAQVFMGMRIQCAQCHNHPFDRWTMDDYYGFAAFFSQIGRKRGEDPRELIVYNRGGGEVNHPVGNRVMKPKFLGGDVPEVKGKDRRAILAGWLASPDNPYFARNLANIVWAHFFGRGIIHEVDDIRVSNPPSNGPLLDALAQRFTDYDYDFKKLVRDICTSRTYQLDTAVNASNASDQSNFARAYVRRIRAETLLDCLSQVTDTNKKFPGLPLGARAVQIADGNVSTYFLRTFGRATRETVCSCEVKMEPTLSQALHLLNGNTTNQRIRQGDRIGKALKDKKSPRQITEELFIRCLCREPTEPEWKRIEQHIRTAKDPRAALEDVFWAVLNTREFMFNH